MKLDRWLSCLIAAVFGFVLSFSAVSCLVTGFGFSVSLQTLALWCAIASAVTALCLNWKRKLIPLGVALLLAIAALLVGDLGVSAEALLYRISQFYDSAYGLGTLSWSGKVLEHADLTAALLALSTAILLCAVFTLWYRKALPGILALSLVPLFACLVVTDTVPHPWCLGLLVFALVWLLLTQLARSEDRRRGNRLCLFTAIPTALATLLLFLAIPQDGYNGQQWADAFLQKAQAFLTQTVNEPLTQATDREDLTDTGRFNNPKLPVMEITADQAGRIYLREQVFGKYTGTAWEAGNTYSPQDSALPDYAAEDYFWQSAGQVSVTVAATPDFLYIPLYAQAQENAQGIVPGQGNRSYNFTRYEPIGSDRLYLQPYSSPTACPDWLSPEVWEWAGSLSAQLTQGCAYVPQAAEAIAQYVRASAEYSTHASRMPTAEDDFVRWFLEDCDAGYCTHFASAATVLLQAAGIPARYVTGYALTVEADCSTTVDLTHAHAWAEYFVPSLGWLILETTPAAPDAPVVTEPTETTQPPEATEPQQPTEPGLTPTMPLDPTPIRPTAPQQPEEPDSPPSYTLLWVLLGILAAILLILGQWQLRLQLKRHKQRRGHPNRRALAYWKEVNLYAKLLKQRPDSQLLALAQKAKFSQHKLDRAELAQFHNHLESCRKKVAAMALAKRLLLRLIFALY